MHKLDLGKETRLNCHTSVAPYALSNWARNKYHHERCFPAPHFHVLKIQLCLQAGGKTRQLHESQELKTHHYLLNAQAGIASRVCVYSSLNERAVRTGAAGRNNQLQQHGIEAEDLRNMVSSSVNYSMKKPSKSSGYPVNNLFSKAGCHARLHGAMPRTYSSGSCN